MMRRRALFFTLSVILCAALALLSACGAGTSETGGNNNGATRPHDEAQSVPSPATNAAEEPAPLPAMSILDDYQQDSAAADRKYKGRTLVISGVVGETGKSKGGVPFISFHRPGAASPAGAMVICSLTPDQEAAVQTLEKGREVKLSGHVLGTLTGNVLLESCVIRR